MLTLIGQTEMAEQGGTPMAVTGETSPRLAGVGRPCVSSVSKYPGGSWLAQQGSAGAGPRLGGGVAPVGGGQ